jgi:hypothetical protein
VANPLDLESVEPLFSSVLEEGNHPEPHCRLVGASKEMFEIGGLFQDHQKQDVFVGASMDGFTAFLK